jgi:hypothetical protein
MIVQHFHLLQELFKTKLSESRDNVESSAAELETLYKFLLIFVNEVMTKTVSITCTASSKLPTTLYERIFISLFWDCIKLIYFNTLYVRPPQRNTHPTTFLGP